MTIQFRAFFLLTFEMSQYMSGLHMIEKCAGLRHDITKFKPHNFSIIYQWPM